MSSVMDMLSLYHLMDDEVLANPYPLYHRLRTEAPVHWDPFLSAWIVTRYDDIVHVLHRYSAERTPSPGQMSAMGLGVLSPVASVLMKQMLFMDAPAHTRLRTIAASVFTPARIEILRSHIQGIVDQLIDKVDNNGRMDVIADLAFPLPAIVTAEMIGVPPEDRDLLKGWSDDFAEVLGNFQHNPDRLTAAVASVEGLTAYFRSRIEHSGMQLRRGLVQSLLSAEVNGEKLTVDEVVANSILTMVGGQETTTNLIGNGMLTLLRNPDQMQQLIDNPSLIPSAIEEMLRYESPSQHTARLAPEDTELGGQTIRRRQAVIAVLGAGNRDPERFPDPDRFDVARGDRRHLAFGWAAHFCFGATLARLEAQVALETTIRRLRDIRLEPSPLRWRHNLGLRGLRALAVRFGTR